MTAKGIITNKEFKTQLSAKRVNYRRAEADALAYNPSPFTVRA